MEDEALEEGVEAAGKETEGTGEEDEGGDCAVFGLEAFEEGDKGEDVKEVVEDVAVYEGVGVEAVYWVMILVVDLVP